MFTKRSDFPARAVAAAARSVSACRDEASNAVTTLFSVRPARCGVRNASYAVLALSALHSLYLCTTAAAASLISPRNAGAFCTGNTAAKRAEQAALPSFLPPLQQEIASRNLHAASRRQTAEVPLHTILAAGSGTLPATPWGHAVARMQSEDTSHGRYTSALNLDSNRGTSLAGSEQTESANASDAIFVQKTLSSWHTFRSGLDCGLNTSRTRLRKETRSLSPRDDTGNKRKQVLPGSAMLRLCSTGRVASRRRRTALDTKSPGEAACRKSPRASSAHGAAGSDPAFADSSRWLRSTTSAVGSVAGGLVVVGAAKRELSAAASVEETREPAVETTRQANGRAFSSMRTAATITAIAHPEVMKNYGSRQQTNSASGKDVGSAGGTAAEVSSGLGFEVLRNTSGNEAASNESGNTPSIIWKGNESSVSMVTTPGHGLFRGEADTQAASLRHAHSIPRLLQGQGNMWDEAPVKNGGQEALLTREGRGWEFGSNTERIKSESTRAFDGHASDDAFQDDTALFARASGEAEFDGVPEEGEGKAVGAAMAAFIEQNRKALEKGDVKLLLLMRHAQSEFNKWRAESMFKPSNWRYDQGVRDVCLTEFGLQQCFRARKELLRVAMALPADVSIDLHLTSPLMRAVQTAVTAFPCPQTSLEKSKLTTYEADADLFHSSCDSPAEVSARSEVLARIRPVRWVLTPLLRERVDTSGDIGSERKQLLEHVEELEKNERFPPGCPFVTSTLDTSLLPLTLRQTHAQCNSWCLEMAPDELERVKRQLRRRWRTEGTGDLQTDVPARKTRNPPVEEDAASTTKEELQQQALAALEAVHDFSEASQQKRAAFWDKKQSSLRRWSLLRQVPLETRDAVFARVRLVLAALCRVRDARIIAMVGHSVTFLLLTEDRKMKNTQTLPYVLDCEAKTVAPLLLEEPGKVGRPASIRFPSEESAWKHFLFKLKKAKVF